LPALKTSVKIAEKIKREKSGKRKQLFGLLKKSGNKAGIKKGSEPESPNPEPRTRKPEVPIYHNS